MANKSGSTVASVTANAISELEGLAQTAQGNVDTHRASMEAAQTALEAAQSELDEINSQLVVLSGGSPKPRRTRSSRTQADTGNPFRRGRGNNDFVLPGSIACYMNQWEVGEEFTPAGIAGDDGFEYETSGSSLRTQITQSLGALVEMGICKNPSHGVYTLTARGAQRASKALALLSENAEDGEAPETEASE